MSNELNEKVAVAMGWTSLRVERLRRPGGISGGGGYPGGGDYYESLCGNPPDGSSPPPLIRHVPKFATDPATIPEMLAWLRGCDSQFDRVEVQVYVDIVEATFWDAYAWFREGKGDTLNLALANLVVAVSEAKKP